MKPSLRRQNEENQANTLLIFSFDNNPKNDEEDISSIRTKVKTGMPSISNSNPEDVLRFLKDALILKNFEEQEKIDQSEEVHPHLVGSKRNPDTSKLLPGSIESFFGVKTWHDSVVYRGERMPRRDASWKWNQEIAAEKKQQEDAQLAQRQRRYEEEKKNIDYEKATYKGFSLNELRNQNDPGRFYDPTNYPSLKDLDPWTIRDLEEADKVNPQRNKEREEECQRRRREEEAAQERRAQEREAARIALEKAQSNPYYYKGSYQYDDLGERCNFESGIRIPRNHVRR